MHMADALISPVVGGTMWAATATLIAYCSEKVRKEPDDREVPLMGLIGAFLFAAQMINFTVPATGSSHLFRKYRRKQHFCLISISQNPTRKAKKGDEKWTSVDSGKSFAGLIGGALTLFMVAFVGFASKKKTKEVLK